jgi:hypothetical protein
MTTQDQNKKTLRHFQCRDYLWEIFEQMSTELECSTDYLINEAMRQYARSRNYGTSRNGGRDAGAPGTNPNITQPPSMPAAAAVAPAGGITSLRESSGMGGRPSIPSPPPPKPRSSQTGQAFPQREPAMPSHAAAQPYAQQAETPPAARMPPAPPPKRSSLPPPPPPGQTRSMPNNPPNGPSGHTGGHTGQMSRMPAQAAPPPLPVGPSSRMSMPPAAAAQPSRQRQLFIVFNGQKIPVTKEEFVIGRGSKSADLAIKDGNISRRHAAVVLHNGAYYMKDLGSTNGVEFQGRRFDSKRIEEGDSFRICDYELRFTYQ